MIRQRLGTRVPASRVAAIALAAIGVIAASCEDRVPGAGYDLSGYVTTELAEGTPGGAIGGATVRFTSDSGRVHETTTGSDGRYELSVFTDTEFGQVRAEAAGFEPVERTVYFDEAQRRIDLVMRPSPEM